MLLLTSAALLVSSVRNLERVDAGFDPHGVLIFRVDPAQNGYDETRTRNFLTAAVERLGAVPGVRSASFSRHTLIANSSSIGSARPAGTPAPAPGSAEAQKFGVKNRVWRQTISDEFLRTMDIPTMAGRAFGPGDTAASQRVAIVNTKLARQLFGTTDVIGRRIVLGLAADSPEIEIVGVTADARYTSMRHDAPATVYLPYRQEPLTAATFAVRVEGDPAAAAPAVREAMRQLDPALPLAALRTQDDQIRSSLSQERLFARLSTLLGAVTLLLAAIGLYGLLAYAVTSRTPEIGVRMALGAARSSVRWMILKQSLALVIAGLALGVPAARAGTRYVESMLFGLTPTDPMSMIVAATALLAISLIAALVPAQRASRVDPIVALRTE
jgi:predicted permease